MTTRPTGDPTACLVSGPVYRGQDVYRVRGGFLAMLGHGNCLEGLFPSQGAAEQAQRAFREQAPPGQPGSLSRLTSLLEVRHAQG